MNIFRKLGARPTEIGESRADFCVFPDGSASEESKAIALRMLGWCDTDEYKFDSWVMPDDATDICPHSVEGHGLRLHLSPRGDGHAAVSYGTYGTRAIYLDGTFTPDDIPDAFVQAQAMVSIAMSQLEDLAWTENQHFDDRFAWDDELGEWLMDGEPVKFRTLWLADGFDAHVVV